MANDSEHNRSSAFTAEQLALMNTVTQNMVQEALKGVFAGLGPLLKDLALTPEKIEALKKPYIDPKAAARELRESQNTREQAAEILRADAARKASCLHKYPGGMDSISLCHNQLDHMARGVCMLCGDWIHPRQWVVLAPDPLTGKSEYKQVPAHRDYARVAMLDSTQGG